MNREFYEGAKKAGVLEIIILLERISSAFALTLTAQLDIAIY